jgi:hypothetical protein
MPSTSQHRQSNWPIPQHGGFLRCKSGDAFVKVVRAAQVIAVSFLRDPHISNPARGPIVIQYFRIEDPIALWGECHDTLPFSVT